MRYQQLMEGLRFGASEKNKVLSSLSDFAMGFEIELNIPVKDIDYTDTVIDEDMVVDVDYRDEVLNAIRENDTYGEILEPIKSSYVDVLWFFHGTRTRMLLDLLDRIGVIDSVEKVDLLKSSVIRIMGDVPNHTPEEFISTLEEINDSQNMFPIVLIAYAVIGELGHLVNEFNDIRRRINNTIGRLLELNQLIDLNGDDIPNDDMDEIESAVLDLKTEIEGLSEILVLANIEVSSSPRLIDDVLDTLLGAEIPIYQLLNLFDASSLEKNLIIRKLLDYHYVFDFEDVDMPSLEIREDYEAEFIEIMEANQLDEWIDKIRVEKEADGQIELILEEPVSGNDIVKYYDAMKRIVNALIENGFTSGDNSGLHISISYKNGKRNINMNKFLILGQVNQLLNRNPSFTRNYVSNIFSMFKREIPEEIMQSMLTSTGNLGTTIVQLVDKQLEFLNSADSDIRFNSVNFNGYFTQDGRVEMRFFGGTGYENDLDDYYEILLKMLYVLKISIDDTDDRTYYQEMFRLVNAVFKKTFLVDINTASSNLKKSQTYLNNLGFDIKNVPQINERMFVVIEQVLGYIDNQPEEVTNLHYLSSTRKLTTSHFMTDDIVSALRIINLHAKKGNANGRTSK